MKKLKDLSVVTTVSLSDDTFAGLMLKVQSFYNGYKGNYTVMTDNFISDRFAKRAYYFATIKKGQEHKVPTPSE
jgi:hypothetical protein